MALILIIMNLKIKIPIVLKKINPIKTLSWTLIIIIILVIAFFSNYIYKNYFGVNKNIQKIIQLSEVVTPITVSIDAYNKILENIDKKQMLEPLNLTGVKYPFDTIAE